MAKIQMVTVEITPEEQQGGAPIVYYECTVRVKMRGGFDDLEVKQFIAADDFSSRLDVFIDHAKKAIKDRVANPDPAPVDRFKIGDRLRGLV